MGLAGDRAVADRLLQGVRPDLRHDLRRAGHGHDLVGRVATGEQNSYGLEVHGTQGVVGWDFRTPGELRLSRGTAYADQPSERLLVGPGAVDVGRGSDGVVDGRVDLGWGSRSGFGSFVEDVRLGVGDVFGPVVESSDSSATSLEAFGT